MSEESLLPIGYKLLLGKYRIEKQLASGGFGNTYEVMNLHFEERYAMKEFFMKGINERDNNTSTVSVSNRDNVKMFGSQLEKFKKEARRLRKFNNPHIVRVHDLFEENETAYYVMDFVDGESLSNRLKRTGQPLKEKEALGFITQVLEALEIIHEKGIWHLDLKPGNIMVDKTGKAILIDFGASKQLSSSDGQTTTSTAMCYTPGYAPPEQIDQKMEFIGPWTDLYALGATLYNLLTGNQPPTVSEMSEPDAFSYPCAVSENTKNLIEWLMKPSRKRRPQSVAEVKAFLNKKTVEEVPQDTKKNVPNELTIIGENPLIEVNYKDNSHDDDETIVEDKKAKRVYLLTYLVDGETYKIYEVEYDGNVPHEGEPSKEGYTFSGWSEIPQRMPAHDVTVKGSFTVIRYKLTYMVDGETYKTVLVECGVGIPREAQPLKEGYTFSGWSEIPQIMPSHDVMVTGSFTVNKYRLTYMVDGKTYKTFEVEYGVSTPREAGLSKEGCSFSGWSEIPQKMPAHDVTVKGIFTVNRYKLTYSVDGKTYKTVVVECGVSIPREDEPSKEGHTFSGWSEIPPRMPAHDITVTGSFTVNKYRLTYMVDDETYITAVVEYGARIPYEAEPSKEGYIFSGWSKMPNKMPAHDVLVNGSFTSNTDKQNGVKEWLHNKSVLVSIIAFFAVCIAVVTFILVTRLFSHEENPEPVSPQEDTTSVVNNIQEEEKIIKISSFDSPLGECSYEGTVNSKGVPDGQGEAHFKDGRYYKGTFKDGNFDGENAYFKYDNGDVFEGSFIDNSFHKGRYTIKADRSYFIGVFKDGQPFKGTWYDKNGEVIGTLTKG